MERLFSPTRLPVPAMKAWLFASGLIVLVSGSPVAGQDAVILEVEKIVQTSEAGGENWTPAVKDQVLKVRDRVRTRQRSRATVKLTDLYMARLEQFTTMEITPALFEERRARLDLKGGAAFLFSREKGGEIEVRTPAANGALRGTQLFVRVEEGGRTLFQVLEGSVEMSNDRGNITLASGEAGEATPGQAPRKTAVLEASNLLQWALYYPAVLDPSELNMGDAEERAVAESLADYRAGDLLKALDHYPDRAPGTEGGRLYKAGVLLAVGRLDEAQPILNTVGKNHPGRRALERMIATVKGREQEEWDIGTLTTAGEAIAESYYLQSRASLEKSREAARRATELAPENGYAWTRLAELEFSHGNTKGSSAALAKALELTPRNAQTHVLQGFVSSAANDIPGARASFEEAVRLDGALGNGWLGLGLVKIKRGDLPAGRADLQTAATVEPTVSIFHSYLGKAFGMEHRPEAANRDLDLARRLDPNDPTPWLYSAVELQRQNRTNEAIGDLQRSLELNDNRRIYRSSLLLDQDRAVRGANLARIYQAAGMNEVAVREATRAVENDYTNPSAHLFLANSFNSLRDPRLVTLRYETPTFNELLLAKMLSPVGGGPLSQFVSQQEYSKLLESDGIGAGVSGEFRSDGTQAMATSVFGTYGKVDFGLDAFYRDDPGVRYNADSNLQSLALQFKWQPNPDDTFYFLSSFVNLDQGYNFDNYDNSVTNPQYKYQEDQEPGLLLGGWNHRWAPGSNTLFLAGQLAGSYHVSDPDSLVLLDLRNNKPFFPGFIRQGPGGMNEFTDPGLRALYPTGKLPLDAMGNPIYSKQLLDVIQPFLGKGKVLATGAAPFDVSQSGDIEMFSAELQHIEHAGDHTLIGGSRFQDGTFKSTVRMTINRDNPDIKQGGFPTPAANQSESVDFQRLSIYGYDYWRVAPWLILVGGASWDRIEHPDNFRLAPINGEEKTDEEFNGKLGFTFAPTPLFIMRGAYTQGLGGAIYDESIRLEPVQISGFNQAYRTVISESLAGGVEAPRYDIWGLSMEGSLPTRTWWGITGNVIEESVDRTQGLFTGYLLGLTPFNSEFFADSTPQTLDYREESLTFNLNQLIGDEFAVGAGYRITWSELHSVYPELRKTSQFADLKDSSTLQEIILHADWNSPTGFFARVEANHFKQDLEDDPDAGRGFRPGDSFWQFNALAGYRFNSNLCEVSAGVLNIGNQDYALSPLNPYPEIVRERTAVLRFRMSF